MQIDLSVFDKGLIKKKKKTLPKWLIVGLL